MVEFASRTAASQAPSSKAVDAAAKAPQDSPNLTDRRPQDAEVPAGGGWRVGRRSSACVACGRAFEDGEGLFSVLTFEPASGVASEVPGGAPFRRIDRCARCHGARERVEGEIHWRTRHTSGPKKARLDLVVLSEVFRQLAARQDRNRADFLFLVTLLMLRHRKLRVVKTESQGSRDFLTVAPPRSKATVTVEVVESSPERMEFLRSQLLALFAGGDGIDAGELLTRALETPAAPADKPAEGAPAAGAAAVP